MLRILRQSLPLLLCLLAGPGHAGESVTLYLMDVPPMSMNQAERKGVVGDMTIEALRRAGYTPNIMSEPSPRAMYNASVTDNALIIPLARLREREPNYTWIWPAIQVRRAFFALHQPADDFSDARERYKAIAVSRGTAGVSILLDNGFSKEQLIEVQQGESAPRMLLAGRVDAWFNLVSESSLLLEKIDPERHVSAGKHLGSTWNYIACARVCDKSLVSGLYKSVESMERDGTIKAIRARYGFVD